MSGRPDFHLKKIRKKMNKYPIYIVTKGRWENPLTAKFLKRDGVQFKMLVEPQEYEQYCNSVGEEYILKLPFSNLGLGSFPSRNFGWKDSMLNGYERHWMFDDNIRGIYQLNKGQRTLCNALKGIEAIENFTDKYENISISGFDYTMFVFPDTNKRYSVNTHVYSALLIKNNIPFRWRLKYNEDVDLCLQVLHNGQCTVLFKQFMINKTSTTVKMKGGNQTELYKNNSYEKKVLKARSLEEIWPQYTRTVIKYNRPHHQVAWNKHFKQQLIPTTYTKISNI